MGAIAERTRPRPVGTGPHVPILRVLRRRRRLANGLVQLMYVAGALAAALASTAVREGPLVDADRTAAALLTVSGGMLPLTGLVFSLLFLVAQFGTSTFTPRLNLFRDNPLVWHSFAFFVAVLVFTLAAAIAAGLRDEVSVAVPALAVAGLVVAFGLLRALQMTAFRSIQLAATLDEVAARARRVAAALYADPMRASAGAHALAVGGAARTRDVRWGGRRGVLRLLDVPALVALAARHDTTIELVARVGDVVGPTDVVARTGSAAITPAGLRRGIEVGVERSLDQDPAFGFRILVDIGVRSLSPAVNDPTSAVQALDAIEGLLALLADRDLEVGHIVGPDGAVRVVVPLPTWDDFVGLALDEMILAAVDHPQVTRRLQALLDRVSAAAPSRRRPTLEARRHWIATHASADWPGATAPAGRSPT